MAEKRKIELLAPAGSWESMTAAIAAGADAVYMGGTRFGARAYAQNPEDEKLKEAIQYVHLHGKKLYLTVNTLLKEEELEQELYSWLAPLYEVGLDAVIVQDWGVVRFIHRNFPDLPIHASTQMTVTGPESGKLLKEYGVVRLVTPRELNLKEIATIKVGCGLEIESFVHGALCYCYSGQCLFSSIVGGRSGNRGRCAQPCRMEYQLSTGKKNNGYLLSLKDLNTVDILPDIIEAGVDSLKIEGRMKKPEYTAGVVSIYRKYLDLYEKNGRVGYKVQQADQQKLWNLFNRKGFTEGYYKTQNGKNMITFTKPDFRGGQEAFFEELNRNYVQKEVQEPIIGEVRVAEQEPISMTVSTKATAERQAISCTVYGEVPTKAQKQPLTKETLQKQLNKTGGTPFIMEQLHVTVASDLYLPVVQLNGLRRKALASLEQAIGDSYKRMPVKEIPVTYSESLNNTRGEVTVPALYVQVETKAQFEASLLSKDVAGIYMDTLLTEPKEYAIWTERARVVGKKCFLTLPCIFRQKAENYLEKHIEWIQKAKFDGYLLRSLESLFFLQRHNLEGTIVADHHLYTWNREAVEFLKGAGCSNTTLPVELTGKEWRNRAIAGEEVVVYGRIPMMVSAQCLKNSTTGCDGTPGTLVLKDRMGNRMPVKNYCTYCYNVIYNNRPLALVKEAEELLKNNLGSIRLSFTTETAQEVTNVVDLFADAFLAGNKNEKSLDRLGEFTRGHYKRETE